MRLSKIKLAGFKSFVEPTMIHLPSNLVGVVGPNGCGKSNVIDAIRWVMGESSAKHLRGESMTDVIFNGSASRKPVGTAAIELFFDNSDGSIGGQYASYAELCIKRMVSRDGQSQYFLNNVRCRRKDITSIFLGTGLGPRSYAIIEQGMISRLIEAKPDELRVYIEEAAGISKYKERRRETENRIRHTRDNLDRLNDLREEVEKQIKHLQRQANQAERYKTHKQDQRRLEAELLAIRLIEQDQALEGQRHDLSQNQTSLEAAIAEQRAVESNIELAREAHIEITDRFNATQGRYYEVQSEISRFEQSIAHSRESRERQAEDLGQAETQLAGIADEIEKDQAQIIELDASLEQLTPNLEQATLTEAASAENLRRIEQAVTTWQETWHEFNLEAQEYQKISQVEGARTEQLEERLKHLRTRQAEFEKEQGAISVADLEQALTKQGAAEQDAAGKVAGLRKMLDETDRRITRLRTQEQEFTGELEQLRAELDSRRGSVETLEALQKAALGGGQENIKSWMAREKLEKLPRLAQKLAVHKSWELAVETVLGNFLQAVCVPRCDDHLAKLPQSDVVLVENASQAAVADMSGYLLSKVTEPGSAAIILSMVRFAADLQEALSIRGKLKPGETVITRDGVWLGQGWVRVNRGQQESGGVITREQDIRELRDAIRDYEQRVVRLEKDRNRLREELHQLEADRNSASEQSNQANRVYAEAAAALNALKQDYERHKGRLSTLASDSQVIRDEMEAIEEQIREAQARLTHAAEAAARLEERRPSMQRQQQVLLEEHDAARGKADTDRADVAQIRIDFESRRASRESANTTLDRVRTQREQLQERMTSLTGQLAEGESPLESLQQELQAHLQREVKVESEVAEQRRLLEGADAQLRSDDAKRSEAEGRVAEIRESVDAFRMQVREIEVRREGLVEQFSATGLELATVNEELPEDADADRWNEELAGVMRRIERLGAINLAAIDEFSEQSERKTYLDAQFEDLTSALDTLEGAIRKIDRETRTRFQETFENINSGLKRIFPRLFGGGHAYLSLEGDDLLNAGVTVMARPPGKRNSNIHLLSGGEKALTAVALIFSIFELNPAPFCLLDEVDAPLDEANVGRFCEIVREMSENVQFLIITHNKSTMEMARQLTGVTMNEPGVSRLVSVDIDEAVQLAAS
jgi:chromosome segregation protein